MQYICLQNNCLWGARRNRGLDNSISHTSKFRCTLYCKRSGAIRVYMQLCPVGGEIMVSWSTTFPGVEIWVHHLSDHCSNSITMVKKDLDEWLVSSSNGQVSGSRVQTLSTFNYCIRKDYRVYNKATLDNHEGSERRGRSWGWNIHWQMCSIRCVVAWYFLLPFAYLFRCNILAPLLGWCARDSSWHLSMRQKSCNQSFERISVSKISLPYMLWGKSGFFMFVIWVSIYQTSGVYPTSEGEFRIWCLFLFCSWPSNGLHHLTIFWSCARI